MRIPAAPTRRLITVLGFLLASAVLIIYVLWDTGAKVPGLDNVGYESAIEVDDIDNLANAADVRMAGVVVGRVKDVSTTGDRARVVFTLDQDAAPLHRGATVRVGSKSLIGESALEVTDGAGPALPSGSTLPRRAARPGVQLRDVLSSLDQPTRQALGQFARAFGAGTHGRKEEIAQTMAGMGSLGREGHTALDALGAQSADLAELARETNTLMEAFDTGEGQIASLVQNSQRLSSATAGQRADIEATMRRLPGVLARAKTATGKLTDLSGALAPVATDLNRAAPDLNTALRELPPTAADIRGLLPSLDGALRRAPATLGRIPTFGRDARGLIPQVRNTLMDVNPMLEYMRPYGHDLAAFFTNYGAILQHTDEVGLHYLKILPVLNEQTLKNNPLPIKALTGSNAYPLPGESAHPGSFTGRYPRVERAPR